MHKQDFSNANLTRLGTAARLNDNHMAADEHALQPSLAAQANPVVCDYDAVADVLLCLRQPMVLASSDGTVISVNAAAAELLGDDAETFVGEHWPSWLANPFQSEYATLFASAPLPRPGCCMDSYQHGPREMQLRRADGHLLSINLSLSLMGGVLPVFLIGIEDLSAQKAEIRRLSTLASTDCLTGLANRRSLTENLERQWQQCVLRRTPISVLIVDVDYFKQFNDLYGHLKGDECLRLIASALSSALPSNQCMAARFGGEEFVLVLPGFNAAMAELVARQVSDAIAAIDVSALGLPQGALITVSQGIASESCGQFRTADAMLLSADTALYRAKRDGRNRIALSD